MTRSVKDSRAGELLNARYELRDLTESGVVSDGYRATDKRERKAVHITLLRPEFALQSDVVKRFLHAGKLLAALHHPNVSQVIAVESDEIGIPFVIEEASEGETLSQVLRSFAHGMPLGAAINIVTPIIDALSALHVRGLAHGELDPEHVVLVKSGGSTSPKLVRFSALAAHRTRAEGRMRVAPELHGGNAAGDARADVWAIGALLYETLCGVPPSGDPTMLKTRAPAVPDELAALVASCLQRDPAQRPAQADEVRRELSAARDRMRSGRPPAKPSASGPAPPKATEPKADGALSFALGATMFQHRASQQSAPQQSAPQRSAPQRSASRSAPPRAGPAKPASAEPASAEPAARPAAAPLGLAETVAEEPTTTVSARPRSAPPKPTSSPAAPVAELKTLSDLAAAFGPIEGAENIVQSESPDAVRAREFRQSMDAAAADEQAKKKVRRREDAGARPSAEPADRNRDARGMPVPLLSRKQLRENEGPRRALSQEEMRTVRERVMTAKPGRWGALGDGLLLAFAVALILVMPLLCDASHVRARVVFGASAPIVLSAFVALSVVAFVRTWSVNVQLRPTMLGPTTLAMQFVMLCVSALYASYFLPFGTLGAIEYFARMALPWGASGFYLFLGIYGVMRAVRDSANNLAYGALIALLYSGGFYASYRSLAQGVLQHRAQGQAGLFSADGASRAAKLLHRITTGASAGVGAADAQDAGPQEQIIERHEIGASEEDDMRAVEQLQNSHKKGNPRLLQLQQKANEVAPQ